MVEALAAALQEARDAGRVIRRLHQLHLRLAHAQERDPHAVRGNVGDGFELEPEQVAIEDQRILDGADDDRHVMDAPELAHGCRQVRRSLLRS